MKINQKSARQVITLTLRRIVVKRLVLQEMQRNHAKWVKQSTQRAAVA